MKKTIAVLILFVGATFAAAQPGEEAKTPAAVPGEVKAAALPRNAVENQDGTYSWTDKDEKRWVFRKASEGFVRMPADARILIPKAAVKSPDGTYLWSDESGKKWVFSQSPFGVSKRPLTEPTAQTPRNAFTKAIDNGDTVTFESRGPFGASVSRYVKSKSDLTGAERQIFDQSKTKPE